MGGEDDSNQQKGKLVLHFELLVKVEFDDHSLRRPNYRHIHLGCYRYPQFQYHLQFY